MTNSICLEIAAEIPGWNARFRAAAPQEVLRWAAEQWGAHMALSCSFSGPAGMVLLDMVATSAPTTAVFYIDTGLLFGETYELVARVRERYALPIRAAKPRQSLAQQAATEGETLWTRDPERCCRLRKVFPLAEALAPYDAWITGIRRESASTRATIEVFEWSRKYNLVKLNPLAFWSDRDVWRYINTHKVPYNPLLDQGYGSIGCHTCTQLPTNGDPRSGRWPGFGKTECGLHVEPA